MIAQASLDLGDGPLATSNARIARDVAELARDAGIARVRRGVGDEWIERAVGYVMEYAATNRDGFLCEDVRQFAHGFGLPLPPNAKAWGAVMRAASVRGVIRAAGYAPANSSNRAPKTRWIAC